jgi:hypothetical protein
MPHLLAKLGVRQQLRLRRVDSIIQLALRLKVNALQVEGGETPLSPRSSPSLPDDNSAHQARMEGIDQPLG